MNLGCLDGECAGVERALRLDQVGEADDRAGGDRVLNVETPAGEPPQAIANPAALQSRLTPGSLIRRQRQDALKRARSCVRARARPETGGPKVVPARA